MNQPDPQDAPLMVSISCFAYNQEPYIRQCLEGFVMQRTNFRFEAIVHDDASTDGTAAIIREYAEKYPDIIKPIYETENQYSKYDGSLNRIMNAHMHGKYIAICEGDDYWTDPLKLQKQVDFLEANPEYGMVYGRAKNFYQEKNCFGKTWGGNYTSFDDLFKKNTIPTLTALYREDLYMQYLKEVKPSEQNWMMGDYPMWLWFAHESVVAFMPEVVGVYRVLSNSASHSSAWNRIMAFNRSGLEIQKFYNHFFGIGINDKEFLYREWYLKLRVYALYLRASDFAISWLSGIVRHPCFLLHFRHYRLLLFFLSRRLRDDRK